MGDREALERAGEQSRRWDSVFNRELSPRGFSQILCFCGSVVRPSPGGLFSQWTEGAGHICVAGVWQGQGGRPGEWGEEQSCFSSQSGGTAEKQSGVAGAVCMGGVVPEEPYRLHRLPGTRCSEAAPSGCVSEGRDPPSPRSWGGGVVSRVDPGSLTGSPTAVRGLWDPGRAPRRLTAVQI